MRDLNPEESEEPMNNNTNFNNGVDMEVLENSIRMADLPGCVFTRLPHKDGGENRVGNPLSKSFLDKVKDGVMLAHWDRYMLILFTLIDVF